MTNQFTEIDSIADKELKSASGGSSHFPWPFPFPPH